jgi:hypothetical protein
MFEVGDLVMIYHHGYGAMEDSPALNLEGTTARIKDKQMLSSFEHRYTLEFIDVVAKKPQLFKEEQAGLFWKDRNLMLLEEPIDIMEVFE